MPHRLPAARSVGPLAALLAALALAGCSGPIGATPRPTPHDFETLIGGFGQRGIAVDHVRSGDPGCDDATLAGPAIAFDARGLDQAAPVRIHLFIFRNRDAYERRRADVDVCAQAFIADAARIEAIDASPFVAIGEGPWSSEFRSALRSVLLAGTGVPAPSASG